MSRHTLAEAQARLPELIARAAAGEEVVIEPEAGPAVVLEVAPSAADLPPVPPDNGAPLARWLSQVGAAAPAPGAPDAAALVRQMRDAEP